MTDLPDPKELPPLESMLRTGTMSAASIWARFMVGLPDDRAAHVQTQMAAGWVPVVSFVNAPTGWRALFGLSNKDGDLQTLEMQQSKVQIGKLN